jgi:hypothetical protein
MRHDDNLTFYQHNALRAIRDDSRFIILSTDKKLGPSIMETEKYKDNMIREHLSTVSYRQIIKEQAMVRVHESIAKIKDLTIKTGYLEARGHT